MSQSKTEWRRVLLGARRALPADLRRSHSLALAGRLGVEAAFASATVVLAYEAIGAEVDPSPLVTAARAAGRAVYVPGSGDVPTWIRPAEGTEKGPATLAADAPRGAPVVVLVPGLGFDAAGARLGRGAGFYDRALTRLRAERPVVAIGLAYEVQIVPRLPLEPWDQPVDLIATEARLIRPTAAARTNSERDVEEVPRS